MSTALPRFDFIDLFAGVGGFHHALEAPQFGGRCVLAAEIDRSCRTVLASTWPALEAEDRVVADIRSLTLDEFGEPRLREEIAELVPDHDVLCAGFPCQPFSKSGAQLGVMDSTRGTLFFDIAKIVEAKRPKFLILENVRNLAGPRHAETWERIVETIRSLGYRVAGVPVVFTPHFLPPDLNGRPQSRDRVFILATRIDLPDDEELTDDLLTEQPLVRRAPVGQWDPHRWNIGDFLLDETDEEAYAPYKLRDEEVAWLDAWNAFIQGIGDDDLPGFPIWVDAFQVRPKIPAGTPKWKSDFLRKNSAFYKKHRDFINEWRKRSWLEDRSYRVKDFPASRRKFEWQARIAQPKRKDRNLWELTIHFRPSGIRVKPATYLPALVAITQTSIIGSRRRRITPVEAARLQGLPDWVFPNAGVDDATAYKQAGNGVNVGVVQYVAAYLFANAGYNWGRDIWVKAEELHSQGDLDNFVEDDADEDEAA
jgi:DNA (cytosine-5)-methyltransferase 1